MERVLLGSIIFPFLIVLSIDSLYASSQKSNNRNVLKNASKCTLNADNQTCSRHYEWEEINDGNVKTFNSSDVHFLMTSHEQGISKICSQSWFHIR